MSSSSHLVARPAVGGARVLLVIFLLFLGFIVLMPGDGHAANGVVVFLARFVAEWGVPYGSAFEVIEFGANVALFVPLGVLLPLAFGSLRSRVLWLTLIAGFALSASIELAQRFISGRVSDPRDIIANTLGTLLGLLLVLVLRPALASRRQRNYSLQK